LSDAKEVSSPLIMIVSAPSGSGKTTIVEKVLDKVNGLKRSISYTTRAPREGEKEGADYMFISREVFMEKVASGEFLEWEENFDNCYGTSAEQVKEAVGKGDDIILSIDVKGARKVRERFPESVSVFIMPPSAEELKERLVKRAADEKSNMQLRLQEADREMSAADEYDYIIVNEDLERAVDELCHIIEVERKNRKREG